MVWMLYKNDAKKCLDAPMKHGWLVCMQSEAVEVSMSAVRFVGVSGLFHPKLQKNKVLAYKQLINHLDAEFGISV